MRTRTIVITLLLAVLCAAPLYARQFEQGEKIYVNADQSGRDGGGKFNWAGSNAKLFLYVWKESNGASGQQWLTLTKESGNIYACSMPAGEFNRCIVVRKNSNGTAGNWNDLWDQTGDLTIHDELNCIYQFWKGGSDAVWWHYTPILSEAVKNVSSTGEEAYSICPGALGGPYALHVKLNAAKTDYVYNNVIGFCWFYSTDKQNWKPISQNSTYPGNMHDPSGDKDIIDNVLPSSLPSGTLYYYLYSAKAAGCRLIKLTTDGKGCELDCTITAFEVATSAVNANDTTYTLDGMIAFGEPNGDLVIECEGKSKTIPASEAKSPQIFSIEGLRAVVENGKTTTARAYFTGNESGCSATTTVNIPNATHGIRYVPAIDLLVGDSTPLNPEGANYENDHYWFVDGERIDEWKGAQTSIVRYETNTTRYTYREMKTPPDDMKDMMENGGYETTTESFYGTKGQKSTISDYNFWGLFNNASTQTDYYSTNPGASNGFAVVQSANNFAPTYAKVQSREGKYFALFDAVSGNEMAGKKAWFATTQPNNPNLKLQKNTTYLFSFWAANINNYGEMDNAAKLQFQIEYNGKKEMLGDPLDLGSPEFRNNRWHQCSATYTAKEDADNVTISVVNLNNNTLNIGNDFALDDIQFRGVSSPSASVKIQDVFTVRTHEPAITAFTATPVQMNCDGNTYAVHLHIEYQNQISKIIVKDITDGRDSVVWEKELEPLTNGSDLWDQVLSLDPTVQQPIAADEPLAKERKYKVYFEKWEKATMSVDFTDPIIPMMEVTYYNKPDTVLPCGQKTYSISGRVTYRNMNAKAYAWIDNAAKVEIADLKMNSADELTAVFTIDDVPADSAEHVLHVAFEGRGTTCPFEDTFRAAFAPVVDDVKFIGVAAELPCDDPGNYTPQVQVRTSNHRNAILTVEFEGQTPAKESRVVTSDVTVFDYPVSPVDGESYKAKVYFDYVHAILPDCEKSCSFTAPQVEVCCNDKVMFSKWENVLFIANGDGRYATFQWYKNGNKLSGETAQRYYAGHGVSLKGTSDLYHCVMSLSDGSGEEESCPHTFDEVRRSAEAGVEDITVDGVAVYPTQVSAGGEVTIHIQTGETIQATLLTLTGQVISTHAISGEQASIEMPEVTGMYLLRLQGQKSQRLVKINVN